MSTSGGSSAPSGAAGGDLSGTYPNPTVAQINGTALGTLTGASTNNALTWNGSAWVPQAAAGGAFRFAHVANLTTAPQFSNTTAASFTEVATLGSTPPGTGSYDLQVAASAGDVCMVWLNMQFGMSGSGFGFLDFETVTGSHFISGGLSGGVNAWATVGTTILSVGSPQTYTVVSGDISGGNVKFRFMAKVTTANSLTLFGGSGNIASLFAINLTALATGS